MSIRVHRQRFWVKAKCFWGLPMRRCTIASGDLGADDAEPIRGHVKGSNSRVGLSP